MAKIQEKSTMKLIVNWEMSTCKAMFGINLSLTFSGAHTLSSFQTLITSAAWQNQKTKPKQERKEEVKGEKGVALFNTKIEQ